MLLPSPLRNYADGEHICTADHFPPDRLGPWLSALVDACLDSMLVVDDSCQIVLANTQAGDLFKVAPKCLLGRSLDTMLAPQERIVQRETLRRLSGQRPEGRRSRLRTTLQCVRANGEGLLCEALIACGTLRGAFFFSVVMRAVPTPTSGPTRQYTCITEARRGAIFSHRNHEIEKRRFSRVLYDDLGQSLGVLKLDMDGLQQSLTEQQSATMSRVTSMQSTLDGAISRVKSIASALRPPLLDDFGLIPTLLWVAADFQKKTGIHCVVKKTNISLEDDDQVESAIFRLVQESLANIEQHAQASDVTIFLWQNGCTLDVLVHDDGIGIQQGSPDKPGCNGLIAMQERITTLQGTLTISNIEPHGLAIHASIPVSLN